MHWKVGELAKLAKISVRTLHHYEAIGLLIPAERSENGYRLYNENSLYRLMQIICLSQVGMSLDDVKQALAEYPDGILSHLKEHLQLLSDRLAEIETLRNRLQDIVIKIADNRQPTWLDWAVSPELVGLYHKWCESDKFDTLALYESYLLQSPQWQKTITEFQSSPTDANAWVIVTSFETFTDFNLPTYENFWHSTNQETFANVNASMAKEIWARWQSKHLAILSTQLTNQSNISTNKAIKKAKMAHHEAIQRWPKILTTLHQFERQLINQQSCDDALNLWLLEFSQNNKVIAKEIINALLSEPRLQQGLCLSQPRTLIFQNWLFRINQSQLDL